MHRHVSIGVAETLFDLVGAAAGDLAQVGSGVGGNAARQFAAAQVGDRHRIPAQKVALDTANAGGQQAAPTAADGIGGAVVHQEHTCRFGAGENPRLAAFRARLKGREARADGFTGRNTFDHIRLVAGSDHHIDAGMAGNVGRLQLGGHAARPQAGDAAARRCK